MQEPNRWVKTGYEVFEWPFATKAMVSIRWRYMPSVPGAPLDEPYPVKDVEHFDCVAPSTWWERLIGRTMDVKRERMCAKADTYAREWLESLRWLDNVMATVKAVYDQHHDGRRA